MITDFVLDDQVELMAVALSSWKAAYSSIFSEKEIEEFVSSWYSLESSLNALSLVSKGEASFKVARLNGKLVGFMTATVSGEQAELRRIYVDPAHWEKGYGKRLLESALAFFRSAGFQTCIVRVHKDNSVGKTFYSHNEFSKTSDDGDEEVWQRTL